MFPSVATERAMSAALALFVPHAPSGSAWVVRRAHTIVDTCRTQREAIDRACAIAADQRMRRGGEVRIEVQNPGGGWRVFCAASPQLMRGNALT
jgi:hypothetical protein